MDLTQKKCRPCEGGIPKLNVDEAKKLLAQVPTWDLEEKVIRKNFKFKNFREAMKFINRMAEIAEAEGHHPDFTVHYNRVEVEIWTHAIGGLSENDFILAAKLDQIDLKP
jgi:4a-hydroxytetrahydrobiopterin dehydratase